MSRGVRVELVDVTRRYGKVTAIDSVSFSLEPGEVLGLLGPNGAGKTTTMRVLTGYLRPSSGVVRIEGRDVTRDDVERRRLLGYVPEVSALYPEMTVTGYLAFWARLRRIPRGERSDAIARALKHAGLLDVAASRIGVLSHGYRQRVAISQALLHDPAVLVLDEPTSGLDPRQVTEVRALIAKLGKRRTVLFSSHLLSEVAQLCKRVVLLDHGRVVASDDVAALQRAVDAASLEEAYLKLVR